jgi:hypothetical protein
LLPRKPALTWDFSPPVDTLNWTLSKLIIRRSVVRPSDLLKHPVSKAN